MTVHYCPATKAMTCVTYPNVLTSDEPMPAYPTHDKNNNLLEIEFGPSVFKVPLLSALRVMRLCGCARARACWVHVCMCADVIAFGSIRMLDFCVGEVQDQQTIWVQEMPEKTPVGQLPRSVAISIDYDMAGTVKPGDRIQVPYCAMPHGLSFH